MRALDGLRVSSKSPSRVRDGDGDEGVAGRNGREKYYLDKCFIQKGNRKNLVSGQPSSVSDLAFPEKMVPDFPLVSDLVNTARKVESPQDSKEESEDLDSTLEVARSLMVPR